MNNIDIGGFLLKTKYGTDKWDLEKKITDEDKKIPDTRRLLKNDHNVKISELENKIPIIRSLALSNWIESALNPIENKIPNVSSLVKKKQIMT